MTDNAMHLDMPENKSIYRALSLIIFLQVVSFLPIVPIWLSSICALIGLFSYLFYRSSGALFRVLVTAASVILFGLFYRLNFTVEMAASFLMLSATLKLLEIKAKRDIYLFVFVMLYLSSASFLFVQSVLHTLLQMLILLACFSALMIVNAGGGLLSLGKQWGAIVKVMALAAPLVIICFLFFPRIAPLWSIPVKTQNSATTGMSDSMSPGDIAELGQSSERAFRVEFSGQRPDQRDLYWRGLILDFFDGRRWRQSKDSQLFKRPQKYDLGQFYRTEEARYQVMLEPHNQLWVFALEGSVPASSNLLDGDMGLFRLKTEAIQATRFQFAYRPSDASINQPILPTAQPLTGKRRRHSLSSNDLQVPALANPKTRAYISRLRAQFDSDVSLAAFLLGQFRELPFYYTLRPLVLGNDFVDEFFFESRRGFCEHYAGSLAYMLRLAGIPARVVLGYQGGEWNGNQNYLIVHQYDAHAWVEAYFEEYGWVRLDPTAQVAPSRILQSLEEATREEGSFMENNPLMAAAFSSGVLGWARLKLDELNYNWQKWVVNYGQSEQSSIMKELFGHYSLSRIIWLFVITSTLVGAAIAFYLFRPYLNLHTPAQRRYLFWLSVLKRFGYERSTGESPRQFLNRVQGSMSPKLFDMTRKRTEALERAEYGA